MLTNVLEERSVLIDLQKVENAALRMQGRMLNERLIQAGKEARALEERCDVELAERSRLLNESESELAHLRGEIEIARGAEDDLRVAIIEIDGRANAAIQNLNAEKSQLQAALDRANGERARFVHELAGMKRRQADEFLAGRAARQCDVRIDDIAAERARCAAYCRLPRRAQRGCNSIFTLSSHRALLAGHGRYRDDDGLAPAPAISRGGVFVATAGDLPQVVLVQDNSHLNLTPASALPNRAHPFAAVIAIVISPASIGTIIHQDPLEIP